MPKSFKHLNIQLKILKYLKSRFFLPVTCFSGMYDKISNGKKMFINIVLIYFGKLFKLLSQNLFSLKIFDNIIDSFDFFILFKITCKGFNKAK